MLRLLLKISIIMITLLTGVHCSHSQLKNKENEIPVDECSKSLYEISHSNSNYSVQKSVQNGTGKLISYSFTGAAYTVEALWDVTAGVVTAVALLPFLITEMYAPSELTKKSGIKNLPIGKLFAPPLGKKAYQATREFRCPDLTELSQSIRGVAECYYNKGGDENRLKALKTIESIRNSGDFFSCLPTEELNAVTKDLYLFKG